MSKEKQFEEMAKIAKQALDENRDWRCKCDICVANIIDGIYCDESAVINGLYNAGYRKQSEGEWMDRYNGKYANSLYVCSLCDERAPLYIKADELGNEQIVQMLSQFCPNCGSHMKGV